MSDPHPVDPFEDPALEDPGAEERDEELDREEEARGFVAEVTASSKALEQVGNAELTGSMAQDLVVDARTPFTNPREAISRPSPNPRLDALIARRDAALATLTDADVSAAHITFVDQVLGVDLGTTGAGDRGATADRLLARMRALVQEKPVPPTGDANADAQLQKVVEQWKKLDDGPFWESLAAPWDGDPVTADGAKEHLAFLRVAGDLTPLGDAMLWRTADAKAWAIDQIIQASSASPAASGEAAGGRIDIAAMYRRAGKLISLGKPVPRSIGVELVRIALAELSGGVKATVRRTPEPARDSVKRRLEPQQPPAGASPSEVQAANARNRARAAATDLLGAARTDTSLPKNIDIGRVGSARLLGITARAGRAASGEMLAHSVADVVNAIGRSSGKGAGNVAKRAQAVVDKSGVVDAVAKWSDLYNAQTRDPAKLEQACGDLKVRLRAVVDGLNTGFNGMDPTESLAFGLLPTFEALVTEVGAETAELLSGQAIETGTRLGGPRAATHAAGLQGRARNAAVIARDGKGGLSDFVSKQLASYTSKSWYADIKTAADAWTTADQTDLATMLAATSTFSTSLSSVRAKLSGLAADEAYFARNAIDALAHAVIDRLAGVTATGESLPPGTDLPTLTKALDASLATFDAPANLASYWKTAKSGISGVPDGLDLSGCIAKWIAATQGDGAHDVVAVARTTYAVAEAVTDYRQRIESGSFKLADKATLLRTLDTILFTMSKRVAALDGQPARV
jgi:hypothetical protein